MAKLPEPCAPASTAEQWRATSARVSAALKALTKRRRAISRVGGAMDPGGPAVAAETAEMTSGGAAAPKCLAAKMLVISMRSTSRT